MAFTSTTAASGQSGGLLEYKWQYSTTSDFSSGITDIGSSNSATYDDATTLTATRYYRRQARVACAADWSGAVSSNILTVTVRSNFSAGSISTTGETFCISGTPAQISNATLPTGGDETYTYQWQSSTSADFSANLTTLSSSNSASFTPAGPVTSTTYYRRQAKDGTCNSFTTSTGSWTITVNQLPASSPAVSHTNTGQTTTNVRFTWTTPADADGVNVYDATSNTLLQSGNTSGVYNYTTTANTQVGIKVKAYKSTTSCENASFGTAAYAYSSQNTPTGLAFSSVGQYTITATASGTMANPTAGSSGVLITNTTNSDNSGWFTTISDPWVNDALLCNTSYS
ncbi:MAG: hypothetical protein ACK5XN_17955, partial [Bacteroidota bacterium]